MAANINLWTSKLKLENSLCLVRLRNKIVLLPQEVDNLGRTVMWPNHLISRDVYDGVDKVKSTKQGMHRVMDPLLPTRAVHAQLSSVAVLVIGLGEMSLHVLDQRRKVETAVTPRMLRKWAGG